MINRNDSIAVQRGGVCVLLTVLCLGCSHAEKELPVQGQMANRSAVSEEVSAPPGLELVDVYRAGKDGYPNVRIPALAVSVKGTLLAFAEGRQGGDHSENDIILKRSMDNGKTWGAVQVVAEKGGDSLNDPCAVVLRESGRIFLMFQRYPQGYHSRKMNHTERAELGYGGPRNTQTFLTRSDDDGVTWSELEDITRSVRMDDAIAVGSPGIGIELAHGDHRGRILMPLYETLPLGKDDRYWRNCAAISDDGGTTWRVGERVPHEGLDGYANECQLVELPDGAILLNARNQDGALWRKSAVSTDGGETWQPMREDPDVVSPPCMGSIVAYGRGQGRLPLLFLSAPHSEDSRENGTIFVSSDGGETWPHTYCVYPGSFAYSCLAVLPDGKIGCLFERDRYMRTTFVAVPVDEIMKQAKMTASSETYITLRGDLRNSRICFERDKRGRVVFLGGSITHMTGWRGMVSRLLEERYPDTAFEFVDAGIPSTDSTLGAARLERDVFSGGPPDLLFVEFAVNDSTNGRTDVEMIRGMEGVIRQARLLHPETDVVMLYFVDPDKMQAFKAGGVPKVIVNHEKVAGHYGVPSIDLAREVTDRITAGEFDWDAFGGIHPAPFGHGVYRDRIERLLDAAWAGPLSEDASIRPHPVPPEPIDTLNYCRSRFIGIDQATVVEGWRIDTVWVPKDKAGVRTGYVHIPMLVADAPGATFTLEFRGTAVGVVVAAGPDAGVLEFCVDDGPTRAADQYTQWSGGLHIPWAHTLAADLAPGDHTLTLRMADAKNPASLGHAARIKTFYVNGD